MFRDLIRKLFGAPETLVESLRPRITETAWPAAIYAIGDVHGSLEQLLALEAMIIADAATFSGEKWIVLLGDYVDRGPDSKGVLEHLTSSPPEGFKRIAIAGNHDTIMLDFIDNPSLPHQWMQTGGDATLASYDISTMWLSQQRLAGKSLAKALTDRIPASHIALLRDMPLYVQVPGVTFVHGGIDRSIPIEDQGEDQLLWLRPPRIEPIVDTGPVVVHGHTPVRTPTLNPFRINLDTKAFSTGVLTAIKLTEAGERTLLQTASTEIPEN